MTNPWQKVAHTLTYVSGPNIYEWKRSAENWILSIPAPSAPNKTIYEDFEEEFAKSWTNTNESYHAAAALDKLRMKDGEVDEYITTFTELARKALYHENDPAVLEKFKSGLPLKLLEPCMHHDDPRSWEAWTRSTRTCQAILTSIKIHQTDTTQRLPSPMEVYTPTPPSMPSLPSMEVDKMYTIPARRQPPHPRDEEKRRGLCHLCKRQGHIQCHCPKKTPEQPVRITHAQTVPLVMDQGIKRPRSPTTNSDDVLRYLKRTTPENRNEIAAELMKPANRQDFSPA
jgi:Retrotransposon gag protein